MRDPYTNEIGKSLVFCVSQKHAEKITIILNELAEKYHCTPNTINRTVKTLLTESEYTILKKKRSKISNKKEKLVDNEKVKQKEEDLEQASLLISFKEKGEFHEQCVEDMFVTLMNKYPNSNFEVCGRFMRRGGIDINPIRSNKKNISFKNFRVFNQ